MRACARCNHNADALCYSCRLGVPTVMLTTRIHNIQCGIGHNNHACAQTKRQAWVVWRGHGICCRRAQAYDGFALRCTVRTRYACVPFVLAAPPSPTTPTPTYLYCTCMWRFLSLLFFRCAHALHRAGDRDGFLRSPGFAGLKTSLTAAGIRFRHFYPCGTDAHGRLFWPYPHYHTLTNLKFRMVRSFVRGSDQPAASHASLLPLPYFLLSLPPPF